MHFAIIIKNLYNWQFIKIHFIDKLFYASYLPRNLYYVLNYIIQHYLLNTLNLTEYAVNYLQFMVVECLNQQKRNIPVVVDYVEVNFFQ